MRIYCQQAFLATLISGVSQDMTLFAFWLLLLSCCLNVLNVQRAMLDQSVSRENEP
jgi:hypothetical protein